jgi:CubicO group peptidase (beta-lactamase class C family)
MAARYLFGAEEDVEHQGLIVDLVLIGHIDRVLDDAPVNPDLLCFFDIDRVIEEKAAELPLGFERDSLCTAWSVSKSVTSALVGIAISEGYIKRRNDPITNYLPELKGKGFDAITIRNLLTMGSGIRYRIGFFPWDEFVLAGYYPNLRQLLLSDLKVMEPPGQSFHYNNFNTELIGMILERTTHRPPSQYLQEKIWKPIGMEYPATWSIDSEQDGFEITPILLNARAIDLAKIGRLYLNGGNWDGNQIIPEHWVVESTVRDANDHRPWETFSRWQDGGGYNKYFWWGVSQGARDYSYMGMSAAVLELSSGLIVI